jgi:hypothetical protein
MTYGDSQFDRDLRGYLRLKSPRKDTRDIAELLGIGEARVVEIAAWWSDATCGMERSLLDFTQSVILNGEIARES